MTQAIPAGQRVGKGKPVEAGRARVKLVTVHGKGAGHTDSRGERWWQLGSPFQVELAKRLALDPGQVEIVPFQWDVGPNSENGRRAAGIALYDKLREYDRAGEDYHLIGHSHGGSVIYNALLRSVAKGKPLERLKSWCTVGTPFLDYRRPMPLSRLNRKRLGEAISALSNVKLVSGPIIPADFLVPFVAVAPVLLTVIGSLAAALHLTDPLLAFMQANLPALVAPTPNASSAGTAFTVVVYIAVLAALAAIFVAVTTAIVALVKYLVTLVGWPLSKMIDSLVWSSIRQQAWGDDRVSEGVSQIGAHPPEFAHKFAPLPDAVGDQLSRFSEKNAILTLTKVREVLGMTRKPRASPDMRAQLSEQLNWQELIHTTYFDIPEFVDLAAIGLSRAGLSDLTSDFWNPGNRDAALEWYRAISTPTLDPPDARIAAA